MMQLYNILLYVNIDYPENLRGFLKDMDFANLGFVPNLFVYAINIEGGKIYKNGKFKDEEVE